MSYMGVVNVNRVSPFLSTVQSKNGSHKKKSKLLPNEAKEHLIAPKLEPFFKFVNGESNPPEHNYFCLKDITKALWPLYLPLQIIGLISDRLAKLARAWYGTCWAIDYSCFRPWINNRKKLVGKNPDNPIPSLTKKVHLVNEYFRIAMGSLVSLVYGGGALGMLWGVLRGSDDLYEKAQEIFQIGMFNQNQIFASMNATNVLKRQYKEKLLEKLQGIDEKSNDPKGRIELVDTILFIPNILTRALDTFRLFGVSLSESLQKIVNSLGYFSYGTWAAKYGILKTSTKEGGDLKPVGNGKFDQFLYNTQKHSGTIFSTFLPALSWFASGLELIGKRELAQSTFKLEGIMERLNPAILSWSIRETWMKIFKSGV